jgi:putative membrane protein
VALTGTHVDPHHGFVHAAYLAILGSHMLLAMLVVPLVLVALVFAWRRRFDKHRAVARWTFPVWLYVSVTGVVVYAMLYHLPA